MRPNQDSDTRTVIAALRQAVQMSGLSQGSFARALGTSPSRFSTYLTGTTRPSAQSFVRAQRIAGALRTAAAQGLMSAPATGTAMEGQLEQCNTAWTWRMLLQGRDHLRFMLTVPAAGLDGSWEAAPSSTGSVGFDGLLAAVAQREFEAVGRAAPVWTLTEALEQAWVPEHPFLTPERVVAQTPPWLRDRNIFVPERDLVTA